MHLIITYKMKLILCVSTEIFLRSSAISYSFAKLLSYTIICVSVSASQLPNPHEDILPLYKYFLNFFGCIVILFVIYAMMMRKYFLIPDDIDCVCFQQHPSNTGIYSSHRIGTFLTKPRSFIGVTLYNSALN
jgi:hypothetical protein